MGPGLQAGVLARPALGLVIRTTCGARMRLRCL